MAISCRRWATKLEARVSLSPAPSNFLPLSRERRPYLIERSGCARAARRLQRQFDGSLLSWPQIQWSKAEPPVNP
jgi:hypothetical protein